MITLATELLTNKYVIGFLGALIGALYLYTKGKSVARKEAETDQLEAQKEQSETLHKAEADNQKENGKREQDLRNVEIASGINSLIKLFNALKRPPKNH